MKMYIPSRGRARTTCTYRNLPPALQKITTHVVPRAELAAYIAAGLPAVTVPPSIDRIAKKRQWIVEYHMAQHPGIDKIVMLDDDLAFSAYNAALPSKYGRINDEAVLRAFHNLRRGLDAHAHASILMRQGSNRHEDAPAPLYDTRMCCILAYRVSVLREHWPATKFGAADVLCDFYMTLALATLGYRSITIADVIQGQVGGSGASGGCSTYRTMEYHAQCVHELQTAYPAFVRIVEKPVLKSWGGQPRIDVVISWKKAVAHGITTHGLRKLRRTP